MNKARLAGPCFFSGALRLIQSMATPRAAGQDGRQPAQTMNPPPSLSTAPPAPELRGDLAMWLLIGIEMLTFGLMFVVFAGMGGGYAHSSSPNAKP